VLRFIDGLATRLSYRALFLPFALYCAIVLFWLGTIPRYEMVSDNLIANANFEQGRAQWQVADDAMLATGDTLALSASGDIDQAVLSQTLHTRQSIVRFTAMVRVTGSPPGTQHEAGIFLTLDPPVATFPVARFMEPHEWYEYESFLQIPNGRGIDALRFFVPGDNYTVELRDMKLIALEVQPSFLQMSLLLYVIFWAFALAVAIVVIAKLWRNMDRRLFWLLVAGSPLLLAGVLYFATTTRPDLTGALFHLGRSLPEWLRVIVEPIVGFVLQENIVFFGNIGAKLLHFGFFFIAGLVAAACAVLAHTWFLVWVLLVLTVGTETLQTFEVSRSGSFYDIGVNMAGLFAGYLLCAFLLLPFRRKI
jgi:hypothetical protein